MFVHSITYTNSFSTHLIRPAFIIALAFYLCSGFIYWHLSVSVFKLLGLNLFCFFVM